MYQKEEQAYNGDQVCYSDEIPHLLSGYIGVKTYGYHDILTQHFSESKYLDIFYIFSFSLVNDRLINSILTTFGQIISLNPYGAVLLANT